MGFLDVERDLPGVFVRKNKREGGEREEEEEEAKDTSYPLYKGPRNWHLVNSDCWD